jgi:site-specific DNA recombinase
MSATISCPRLDTQNTASIYQTTVWECSDEWGSDNMADWEKREHTKGEIDRAGKLLVEWWTSPEDMHFDKWNPAYQVVKNWGACHGLPLNVIQAGLRQRIRRIEQNVVVAIVDSLYIRELAKKVHRGVEGLALRGLHTGGRCFGYRSVPVEDSTKTDTYGRPLITGVRLEIDESQASIVRRIFTDYAAGDSIKTVAKRFNAEGVVSPLPYRGQRHPSWAPSAISVMLHNDRYRGTVIWNRTRKVRDPRTGRRVQRLRPQTEWKIQEAPHLRIVSEEVWQAVQRRLSSVKTAFANGESAGLCTRAYSAPYLLSGFLKCGICGSKMVVVSGRGQSGRARYGCPLRHARGICANPLHVRQDHLEREVLEGLQR